MIRLIAAIDIKRGLAKDNQLPWDIPSDKRHFRELTLKYGSNVLMGRRTYDQMSDYLKQRHNFIASHEHLNLPSGCELVNNVDQFIRGFKEDIWVIGGAEIFEATIKYADEIYLTTIEADFKCDRFFPDYSNFKVKSKDGPMKENGLTFYYQLLIRF